MNATTCDPRGTTPDVKTTFELRTLLETCGLAGVGLCLLACNDSDAPKLVLFGQARQALTSTVEPCFDPDSQCTLTRTVNDDGSELIRIDRPAVIRRDTTYDKLVFQPGDRLTFSADGCVQTGGFGDTWKRYVRPLGDDADHQYFGTLAMPGVIGEISFRDLFPSGSLTAAPILIPSTPFPAVLHLGYVDDDYLDNGFNDHDDGNDDQCRISATNDGGPAHITIQVTHGNSTTPVEGDWDLVSNLRPGEPLVFDPNGVDLNPRWGWQTPFRLAPDYNPSSTSQITGHDEAFVCSGHDNWREATATGPVFWNGHDTGFGDDDYNIKIQTRDVPDSVYVSGVTRGNSGADGNSIRMIKGEFDSDETVDQDAFDNIPWWKGFHDAVDEGDGIFDDDGGAAARAKINNHFAIMSGLVGLDTAHPPPASELHPVHALAIRINQNVSAGDDAWAFFVRNWGDEGFCSSDQHYVNFPDNQYTFQLPRPTPAEGVDASAVATPGQVIVQSVGVRTSATISTNPNQDTFLTVNLGPPSSETFVVGEIHLVWPSNGNSSTSSPLTSAAEAAPDEDDDDPEEQVRELIERSSPEEIAVARERLARLQPARPEQSRFDVPLLVSRALPPIATQPPSATSAPALRKQQRTLAKSTALCTLTDGAFSIDGKSMCTALVPVTLVDITKGLPDAAGCLPDLVTVRLTTLDPSGTGTVTEFSYDGQTWLPYAGPFIAQLGAAALFVRSRDSAGHVETPFTTDLPQSALSAGSSQLALLANGNLLVDDGVVVSSPSGSAATIGNAGRGQTNIGVAARVGNIWSAAPVFLRDRSRVEGFVKTSKVVTRQNQVVVTGRVFERVGLSLPDLRTCRAVFDSGLAGVSLEPDQALALAPGKYGPVSVKSRARLSLSPGSYQFQALTLEPQALVQLPAGGGAVLFVQSALTHRGSFVDAGGAIAPVFIAYFGSQSASIEGAFRGAIVAPNSRVDLFRRAEGYRGVFFARDLELHPNMTVLQDPTALIP